MVTKEVNITVLSKMLSEEYERYETKIIQLKTTLLSVKATLNQIKEHGKNAYIDFTCKQALAEIEDTLRGQ